MKGPVARTMREHYWACAFGWAVLSFLVTGLFV